MTLQIDDAFIRKWDPEYEEKDEGDYGNLGATVAQEMKLRGTISKDTFLRIWNWKGAMRVIRHVRLDEYDTRYAGAFRRAASAPLQRKLYVLLEPTVKLPGIDAPTGSTILHFMHPETMPIIDVRTVGALLEAGLVSTNCRDLEHYEEYRKAIEGIARRCPGRSLRQIDRALFAYHKQVLDRRGNAGNAVRADGAMDMVELTAAVRACPPKACLMEAASCTVARRPLFLVAPGLRILPDFAGICRAKLLIFFGISRLSGTHNP